MNHLITVARWPGVLVLFFALSMGVASAQSLLDGTPLEVVATSNDCAEATPMLRAKDSTSTQGQRAIVIK